MTSQGFKLFQNLPNFNSVSEAVFTRAISAR